MYNVAYWTLSTALLITSGKRIATRGVQLVRELGSLRMTSTSNFVDVEEIQSLSCFL
jgi:hypothetical protein